MHPAPTVVEVRGVRVGDGRFVVIAGPCAVESREQLMEAAVAAKAAGADMLRGGAFKPRTSPYDFQGLGAEGLKLLAEARRLTGLPVVTEVLDTADVELVAEYADVMQVGARNMQNYALLRRLAFAPHPVLLKRSPCGTIKEWLLAAEYLLSAGNPRVILCERGIRTFETETRNTLDLAAVALVKELSHLPVIADPSHATGRCTLVPPMARAALAAGADGLMVEIHPRPSQALCDGKQALTLDDFSSLMRSLAAARVETDRAVQNNRHVYHGEDYDHSISLRTRRAGVTDRPVHPAPSFRRLPPAPPGQGARPERQRIQEGHRLTRRGRRRRGRDASAPLKGFAWPARRGEGDG
jgi:3-deoxy-7-phosphoheptulonate synthase